MDGSLEKFARSGTCRVQSVTESCQLFDIGPDYLVLEYVEGKPLPCPVPEKEAVRLAIQIAAALETAHKRGIVHRDLKPGNIMVTQRGHGEAPRFRTG
jgi:serine/threonine protein kinase